MIEVCKIVLFVIGLLYSYARCLSYKFLTKVSVFQIIIKMLLVCKAYYQKHENLARALFHNPLLNEQFSIRLRS
jgi:hypothetical protein